MEEKYNFSSIDKKKLSEKLTDSVVANLRQTYGNNS